MLHKSKEFWNKEDMNKKLFTFAIIQVTPRRVVTIKYVVKNTDLIKEEETNRLNVVTVIWKITMENNSQE